MSCHWLPFNVITNIISEDEYHLCQGHSFPLCFRYQNKPNISLWIAKYVFSMFLPTENIRCVWRLQFFFIWRTTWKNCFKIRKTTHVFYPTIQNVKRKVLGVASFWTYTEYKFCLTGSKLLSFAIIYTFPHLQFGTAYFGQWVEKWFGPGRDKKMFSSEKCPDGLWGPSSILFNHHCGPLHKRSRGHCVKPTTHLLMAKLKYGKDYLPAWRGKVYLLLIFTLL